MSCAGILVALLSIWCKFAFVDETNYPPIGELHSWKVPMCLTLSYLLSLPLLKLLSPLIPNPKSLLLETMVLYNATQVLLNGWTVYYILHALYNGHPIVGDVKATTCSLAVWVHYADKYLEFFDTYFMLLRGNFSQVTFLHVYHHTTIAWAWWSGMYLYPTGDAYFGALLNSWIHVMMYSYYALTLMGVKCPWKKYLTMAQLVQFASVVVYTGFCLGVNYRKGQLEGRHVLACGIQVGEMVSLFILFSSFYKRSYKGSKGSDKSGSTKPGDIKDECNAAIAESVNSNMYVDECHAAVKSLVAPVKGAVELGPGKAMEMTAKSTKKEIENAKRTGKGVSRPSWSFLG
ncbi:hypothetical protein TrCOL_g2243 [Triparma columacea]|nr:hypothetical protein TrCOL_g2243 [Triparma columacea]